MYKCNKSNFGYFVFMCKGIHANFEQLDLGNLTMFLIIFFDFQFYKLLNTS